MYGFIASAFGGINLGIKKARIVGQLLFLAPRPSLKMEMEGKEPLLFFLLRLLCYWLRREASPWALWDIPSFLLSMNSVFIVVLCVCT